MDTKDIFKKKSILEYGMITISLFAVLSIGYIAMDHLGVNKENQAFAQTNGTTMTNNTNTGLVNQQQQQF